MSTKISLIMLAAIRDLDGADGGQIGADLFDLLSHQTLRNIDIEDLLSPFEEMQRSRFIEVTKGVDSVSHDELPEDFRGIVDLKITPTGLSYLTEALRSN
ncbi:hypothetical protein [Pseudovibrio sp. Alg231-02]|uniref:hypothetical protein n=1 Tax=Pseudovibrio sp. Alg231-02 TaxID=1922223 RepID=UPI00131F3DC5|nr:hypothetical protein [Pseudovibrio sp. Alg231-02]